MSDLAITAATAITGANTASGDLFPIVDVSASTPKGRSITRDELGTAMVATSALTTALAAKLDKAGGTMTGALVINPTTGAPLTVQRNSKTCLEVTNAEQINIGRYESFGVGTENHIGWSGKYGAGLWTQGGAGNWYAEFQIGAGTGEFRIASDGGGTNAVRLFNASASSLQLGANHATTATAQTIKAHNVTTGSGADLVLTGGTGSANGGMVKLSNASGDVRMSAGDDGVGFFSAAPQPQATTSIAGGSHTPGSGTGVTDDSTFDGYTIGQIVAGLRSFGLFA